MVKGKQGGNLQAASRGGMNQKNVTLTRARRSPPSLGAVTRAPPNSSIFISIACFFNQVIQSYYFRERKYTVLDITSNSIFENS